ncbi:MAG: hypothetical protein EP338_05220 [Bacteroidetes bacterium]|nr:MAG: hypothetical protein EP338_05220 [Bacteroidota bacterium]
MRTLWSVIFLGLSLLSLRCYSQSDEQPLSSFKQREALRNQFSAFLASEGLPAQLSGSKFLDYHSGIKKAYLFNGSFRFPFTLELRKRNSSGNHPFMHVLQFTPEIHVRIFQNDPEYQDRSKPVRTPSYIPSISYYLSHQNWWKQPGPKKYLGIRALHHSNGEDGWEFSYPDSTVNIYDGSFSESLFFQFFAGAWLYQEQSASSRKNKLLHPEKINKEYLFLNQIEQQRDQFFFSAGYEWHPRVFANEKFYDTQLYGGNRIFCSLNLRRSFLHQSYVKSSENWKATDGYWLEGQRLNLSVQYITDLSYRSGSQIDNQKIALADASKRLNVTLNFYQQLLQNRFLAAFAQLGYHGSDPYNIYFQQSQFVARIGLAFGFLEYESAH